MELKHTRYILLILQFFIVTLSSFQIIKHSPPVQVSAKFDPFESLKIAILLKNILSDRVSMLEVGWLWFVRQIATMNIVIGFTSQMTGQQGIENAILSGSVTL